MGVVQSKKKEVKAYASKYTSNILQNNNFSTSASPQQQSFTTSSTSNNNKKLADLTENSTQTSIYSNDSRSNTPISNIDNNATSSSTNTNKHVVAFTNKNSSSPNNVKNHFDESASIPTSINQSNSYFLPKDWDLIEYQYNLHFSLKTLFGGNVTPAVAPKLKKGARVIKMGRCSGPWIMEMATEYPECHFTVIELLKDRLETIPSLPNMNFVSGAPYEQGFDFPDNSIDYIHLRSMGINTPVDKWPIIFKEFRRILKSDGVIRIEETNLVPKGTVMIESFIETLRQILADNNQDYDIALKYGTLLQEHGFQPIESKKTTVRYASDGKLSEDLIISILNGFEDQGPVLAPKLGLDVEDYRHRVEMITAQCIRINARMDWYSWVGKKGATS